MPNYFAVRHFFGSVPDYQTNPFRVIKFSHFQATFFGKLAPYVFKEKRQAHAVANRLNKEMGNTNG